ncbi:hypothetical protein JCM3775_002542 [Rhodotorula graminis]|uniref:RWD domain-containing protein n=1 Tax=Rhodotorula graminis (strain WP1) TaxID=578459 RepID=A0A194S6H3_RHOGW|nr:uncharacterized protein RHOBADRAFT_66332 [Rhodotorula graminis WP1]KPV76144.1 hypothetical protein RHOBADRAFT_66332 [Rhodotorula graminis WP1]
MTDYAEERRSELEVLESIFPDELEVISDDQLAIKVEPEVQNDHDPYTFNLLVHYTPTYPDEPPELDLDVLEGEVTDEEKDKLLAGLNESANESLGMAMVFTLAQHLKELIADMMTQRKERIAREDEERYRREEEALAARTRGTQVNKASFAAWAAKFEAEYAAQLKREEDERLKALPPREREEARRWAAKLSGRQLWEQGTATLESDAAFVDEGDEAVDISQYERRVDSDDDEVEDAAGRLRLADLSDED